MSNKECNKFLQKIDDCDPPLWMELEDNYNSIAKPLFASPNLKDHFNILLTDDDKVHSELSLKSNTTSLKRHRHVKDNRSGIVEHTAGFPASPAIRMEMKDVISGGGMIIMVS